MKILYAIQGTGNGHISRARDIIPLLKEKGELDILVSGIQADMDLPYPVKYRFNGLSFIFGKSGGVDLLATLRKSRFTKLMREINSLPVEEYDLIINDFEPVSAWACRLKNKVCIGLSHQSAVINPGSPKPVNQDTLGKTILSNYAPVSYSYGFHFQAYAERINTPVIRSQIRETTPKNKNYYTVYLPAYDDKRIIKTLGMIREVEWQVFSKHTRKAYTVENIAIRPVTNEEFITSLINCTGILCGAGFETPAEALFLKKKLMVIPMKGQYEQQCNAAALAEMDVDVIKSLKKKNIDKIKRWTESQKYVQVHYPDITGKVVDDIIENHKSIRPKGSSIIHELSVLPAR
ncbi:glycosyl transferase [Flavihumibacter sp. R14]|nr:glycosyl transferase [Flavihumibacter soli]